ncbi:hypothetical protein ACJ2A9_03490 [Anaerobacillus sp. MEB173]|uniref:hypothetical protein n=1 Tax=Anaerobacillus sp. MEB173 TaxID=3383345 RepID=UPI003F91E933
MKKKILLTAASAVLTIGVLAACGGQDLEEPTLNEEPAEMQIENDDMNGTHEMEEGIEQSPAPEGNIEEFETELESNDSNEEPIEVELEEDATNEEETQ